MKMFSKLKIEIYSKDLLNNVEFQDEIKQTDVKIEYNNSRQKEELEL